MTFDFIPERYRVYRNGAPTFFCMERRNRPGYPEAWAIKHDRGYVLNAQGYVEWEPQPANRTDDFIRRTHFPELIDAQDALIIHFQMAVEDVPPRRSRRPP